MVETCRRLDIKLRDYLLDILPKLGAWPINRVSELTPATWKVIYKTEHNAVGPFPEPGNRELLAGPSRNFQVFAPLDFLAEVTQHIPDPGEHLIRYFGWYSNKTRGQQAQRQPTAGGRNGDSRPLPHGAGNLWSGRAAHEAGHPPGGELHPRRPTRSAFPAAAAP